jgi:mannitol/fructose-specific phosphotransferase system IIA component (Ntr-type)
MERLRTAIINDALLLDCAADSLAGILHEAVDVAVQLGAVPADRAAAVVKELLSREERFSTAIGHSVAVPHAYLPELSEQLVVLVRLKRPLNMGAPDGIPTRFLFVLLGPPDNAAEHLDTLTQVARLTSDDEFRYDATRARNAAEMLAALDRFLARTRPRPARTVSEDEGLISTGRLCGGLFADIRRRWPYYPSDFRDGLHPKSMTSTLFLYFACMAPTVTFGGLMATATNGAIGVCEMLVATAVGGVIYALLSGQPLNILGGTGPLLVFTAVLYDLCRRLELPFLQVYACVGLWTALFTILLAMTDASCLTRFFTRFTNEIFAALISVIFIVEATVNIVGNLRDAHAKEVSHDVAFLSLILSLGTFALAILLSRFRKTRYLQPTLREFFADFGPTIAVVLMLVFSRSFDLEPEEPETLQVPDRFRTTSGRNWLVNPLISPAWVCFAAAGPALLATVLVYLDHNITSRLVNNRDNKLKKGPGYHLDLAVVGGLVGLCSMFGLPWLVAATVRSLNHVRSLATVEEVVDSYGDRRQRIIHVCETRVTPLAIHLLIGGSILLLPLLQTIPMALLYGLFLYMGVVSITGNQFFERLNLWLTDPALYPRTHYIRNVPRPVIHCFTLLQLVCLVVLWIVKVSTVGILFPLFIALLVPVRLAAGRFFLPQHLAALDAAEDPEEEATTWV